MTHHRVKCVEPYYSAIACGEKLFEVRKNDRFYQAGDTIDLVWWDDRQNHRGAMFLTQQDRERAFDLENPYLPFRIGPLLQGGQFGIEPGYCVFSLLPADAFWQPGEEIGTASEDAPSEGVDAIVRAVVPAGVPVEYAMADQAKPPQARPLMLQKRKRHKETLYVLFFPSLETTGDDGIRLFTQSQIADGFRKAETIRAREGK